jgi:hypothetical protein
MKIKRNKKPRRRSVNEEVLKLNLKKLSVVSIASLRIQLGT